LFSIGVFSNRPLIGAVVLSVLLQLAVTYIPFLQPVFKTTSLTGEELLITVAASVVVFVAVEIEKWWWRRRMANTMLLQSNRH
jgi:Ca2+-transporting ATPase